MPKGCFPHPAAGKRHRWAMRMAAPCRQSSALCHSAEGKQSGTCCFWRLLKAQEDGEVLVLVERQLALGSGRRRRDGGVLFGFWG